MVLKTCIIVQMLRLTRQFNILTTFNSVGSNIDCPSIFSNGICQDLPSSDYQLTTEINELIFPLSF